MSAIEVTVTLRVNAGLSFDVESGTPITPEMLEERINTLQRELDRMGQIGTWDAQMYVQIVALENDAGADLYDHETGDNAQIKIGEPAIVPRTES